MVPRGRTLKLSLQRRAVCDLLHIAQQIPTVPVQRIVDVSRLMAIRSTASTTVGWCTIFTKAYALVCREFPALRRACLTFPWARLYEHPINIASVAIEREYEGEAGVFFANLPDVESMALSDLEAAIRSYKQDPIETKFSMYLWLVRLPSLVRRLAWWYLVRVRGSRKAEFLGTFGVTAYSGLGAESLHPLSPLTTTLTYGVIGKDGRVPVRVVYDHRTLDGATVARALNRLEEILQKEIAHELESATSTVLPIRSKAS